MDAVICPPGEQLIAIWADAGGGQDEVRRGLLPPLLEPVEADLVAGGGRDGVMSAQRSAVGEQGVAPVKQPQLALLERRDGVGEDRAAVLPARSAGRERAAEDPLAEWLGHHGRPVGAVRSGGNDGKVAGAEARSYAVDDGAGEAHRRGDPGG